jgi:hypothetical protein
LPYKTHLEYRISYCCILTIGWVKVVSKRTGAFRPSRFFFHTDPFIVSVLGAIQIYGKKSVYFTSKDVFMNV